jgi:hypothetical protein
MGTLLLIVGWSSVVVWLNVRPRVDSRVVFTRITTGFKPPESVTFNEQYGWPLTVAVGLRFDKPPARQPYPGYKWHLAANIAIGLLAVTVLTFASRYLLRRMVSGLRAVFGKPPPTSEEGNEGECPDHNSA